MKGNFLKKIFIGGASLTAFVMTLCATPVTAFADEAVADYAEKADSYYTYVQNFEDVDVVNTDFNAYYRENALGSAKAEEVATSSASVDSHWYVEDGVLSRINNVERDEDSGSFETNKIALLTFTKEAYLNFEMSVDYKAGPEGFWPVIGIRQLEEGKYYLDDGAGVFVQQSGLITLWGDPAVGGPHEFASAGGGYVSTQWHNLQIKVLGNALYVSVDNAPWVSKSLSADFYDTGYVSLISVNNMCQYRNFRIKALAEPVEEEKGEFLPKPEANTDDALSNLAGGVKDGDLFERADKVNPDFQITEEWKEVIVGYTTVGGCGSVLGVGAVGVLLPTAILLVVKKKDE